MFFLSRKKLKSRKSYSYPPAAVGINFSFVRVVLASFHCPFSAYRSSVIG